MAIAFAIAGPPPAAAKAHVRAAPAHGQAKLQARPSVVAHAAGHKIA